MSLLTIIQDAAQRVGIQSPSVVVSSSDANVTLMLSLANEEGIALSRRHDWSAILTEATITTVATQSQGAVTTIIGSDYDRMVDQTVWNRDLDEPIDGPVNPRDWQQMQASNATGPWSKWRIFGGNFYMYPAPTASQTVALEYVSKNWCQSSGGTGQSAWAADSDIGVLEERLLTLGVIWRFLEAKKLNYAEAFAKYEREVAAAISADGGNPILRTGSRAKAPGVFVSEGSWNL